MLGHLVSRAINGVLTPTLTLQLSHCNELANGEDDVLSIGHPDLSIVSLPWNFLSSGANVPRTFVPMKLSFHENEYSKNFRSKFLKT